MAAWKVFGHFASMTLQGEICNYIPEKKGSGSAVPQALAESSTWAGHRDVSRRARTKNQMMTILGSLKNLERH